jgi:hypothetical protein
MSVLDMVGPLDMCPISFFIEATKAQHVSTYPVTYYKISQTKAYKPGNSGDIMWGTNWQRLQFMFLSDLGSPGGTNLSQRLML